MFEDTSVEKSGDKHVSKGGLGKIYQFIDGSIVGFLGLIFFGWLSVPEARSCFKNCVLSRSVIRNTYGGGYARPCEKDGIFSLEDEFGQYLYFLLDFPIRLYDLFG